MTTTQTELSAATQSYLSFLNGQIDGNTMSKQVMPTVAMICRSVASKNRIALHRSGLQVANDLAQDVMIHLITDSMRLFDRTKPLEPFISQIASRRIRKSYTEAAVFCAPVMPEEQDEMKSDIFHEEKNDEDDLLSQVDMDQAISKIRKVMIAKQLKATRLTAPAVLNVDDDPANVFRVDMESPAAAALIEYNDNPAPNELTPVRQHMVKAGEDGPSPQYTLDTDQKELLDLLNRMHYTQTAFAARLGLHKPTLASYLYGRAGVPPHILLAARDLLNDKPRIDLIEYYESTSMTKIMEDWLTQLGFSTSLDPENILNLSEFLELNKVTVDRWANLSMRPKFQQFLAYHQKVAKVAKLTKPKKPAKK